MPEASTNASGTFLASIFTRRYSATAVWSDCRKEGETVVQVVLCDTWIAKQLWIYYKRRGCWQHSASAKVSGVYAAGPGWTNEFPYQTVTILRGRSSAARFTGVVII